MVWVCTQKVKKRVLVQHIGRLQIQEIMETGMNSDEVVREDMLDCVVMEGMALSRARWKVDKSKTT